MTDPGTLEHLVESYLDLRWNMDPVTATAAGIAEYDHRLGVWGVDDIKQYLAALKSIGSALEECDLDGLEDEIDRTAVLGELRFTIDRFEREQPHLRNPAFWVSHMLEGLYLLVALPRTQEQRVRAAEARIREIPAFLDLTRNTLSDCPRVFVETGLQIAEQGFPLLEEIEQALNPDGDSEFRDACTDARKALGEFADYLRDDLLETANGDFAIGEEAFNFRLHFQHALGNTAPELWRYGLALIEEVEADLSALAAEVDRNRSWRDIVDALRAHHPTSDTLVSAYAAQMERARRFVEDRELAAVPVGELEVVATPQFLRPLIPLAAYQPPGPFSEERRGTFYVTPPDRDSDCELEERMLRDHCEHDLASTALHEGYPGHHLQFLTAQAQGRTVRRVLGTPLTIEGWALYCEEMMREEGFYATPEERLFQKMALLWRACRVVLDVGLHTRGMTFEQAVTFLVDRVHFDRVHAEAEVRRYCAEPAYQLCYAVGCRELMSLRDAYAAAHPSTYSLRKFHDAVLQYGALPVSLIRWGMGLDE